MFIYRGLNENIRTIFIAKSCWCIWLVFTIIYSIIILSLNETIGHISWFLVPVLFANCILLPFTIGDVWTMLLNNKREEDAWFPDRMYGMFVVPGPIPYYIILGGGKYDFNIWEFLIVLPYTIGSVIIMLILIALLVTFIFTKCIDTINVIRARDMSYEKVTSGDDSRTQQMQPAAHTVDRVHDQERKKRRKLIMQSVLSNPLYLSQDIYFTAQHQHADLPFVRASIACITDSNEDEIRTSSYDVLSTHSGALK